MTTGHHTIADASDTPIDLAATESKNGQKVRQASSLLLSARRASAEHLVPDPMKVKIARWPIPLGDGQKIGHIRISPMPMRAESIAIAGSDKELPQHEDVLHEHWDDIAA